jgi:hypothetical protein
MVFLPNPAANLHDRGRSATPEDSNTGGAEQAAETKAENA